MALLVLGQHLVAWCRIIQVHMLRVLSTAEKAEPFLASCESGFCLDRMRANSTVEISYP